MKKTLLSLCLLLALTITAVAQPRPPRPRYRHVPRRTVVSPRAPKHHEHSYSPVGTFRFHVLGDLGVSDLGAIFVHEIPYHFSVGGMAEYQVGRITNLGIGAEYYSSYGEHCRLFTACPTRPSVPLSKAGSGFPRLWAKSPATTRMAYAIIWQRDCTREVPWA